MRKEADISSGLKDEVDVLFDATLNVSLPLSEEKDERSLRSLALFMSDMDRDWLGADGRR